jgi:hypothetical protein
LGGKGGEMTQALYAHMNERKFFKKIISLKKKKRIGVYGKLVKGVFWRSRDGEDFVHELNWIERQGHYRSEK